MILTLGEKKKKDSVAPRNPNKTDEENSYFKLQKINSKT
jgi:hypothetical protein